MSLSTITIGWSFGIDDDGTISYNGGALYALRKYTQKVYVDAKLLTSAKALKKVLRDEGIIL